LPWRKLDHAEDAAMGRRRDADLALGAVGASRDVGGGLVGGPDERRAKPGSLAQSAVRSLPVVEHRALPVPVSGHHAARHSGWTPAARSAVPYLSQSRLRLAANSSGAPPVICSPEFSMRCLTSGCCSTALNSRLSRTRSARGVPGATIMPCQVTSSKPGIVSAMTGRSPSGPMPRFGAVEAMPRTLPDFTWPTAML